MMRRLSMIFWMILAMAPFAGSQNEEKIKKLFEDAIQAMGGDGEPK